MTVAQRFGENLVRYRRRAGLSQEQLGLLADLHRTEIGCLSGGARIPRVDTLLKQATGLDITPTVLLDGISWEPDETQPGRFELSRGTATKNPA